MSRLVNDIVTRLFLNGAWRDISSDVRASSGVVINRGRGAEDPSTPPSTCQFTLDNRSGDYTERDPMGQWFGYLGRNTPLEMSLRLAKDTASAAVSNGWGSTELDSAAEPAWTSYAWTNTGGVASDYNKASGKATHVIQTADSGRLSYLADFDQREADVTVTLSLGFTNVVGGSVGCDIFFRGQSTSSWYGARTSVTTTEEVKCRFINDANDSFTEEILTGLTHTSAQALHIRAQIEGRTMRMKVWQGADRETSEPYEWTATHTDEPLTGYTTAALIDASGWIGVRSFVGGSNTNVPVTFSYDNFDLRLALFSGEVSEWPQRRDVTGNERTVEIEAGDIRRRLSQGTSPLRSALRRGIDYGLINFFSIPTPYAYWPLEDGFRAETDNLSSVVGNGSLFFSYPEVGTTAGGITWAAEKTLPGGEQGPNLTGGGTLVITLDRPTTTSVWALSWCAKQNYIDGHEMRFYTETAHIDVALLRAASALLMQLTVSVDGAATTVEAEHTFTSKADSEQWHQYLLIFENDGSNVDIQMYVDAELANTIGGGTLPSTSFEGLRTVKLAAVHSTNGQTAYQHLAIFDATTNLDDPLWEAAQGHKGEKPIRRAHRISVEDDITFAWIGKLSLLDEEQRDGQRMGAQSVQTRLDLYASAEAVDGGLLYTQRTASGFQFRTLRSMVSRTSTLTLDMGTSKHFSPPWPATNDDRYVRNDVTARRVDGGEFQFALDDGSRMSVSDSSEGGIGRYDTSVTVNVDTEAQLPQQAAWRVHLGTVDEERYPDLVVELHRDEIRGDAELMARLRDLDVGEQITLSGLQSTGIYEDTDQLVVGYTLALSRFSHTLVPHCVPASPYRVLVLDDTTGRAAADSLYTTLAEDLDTTETGITVAIASGKAFWTTTSGHYPLDLIVGGERMTASACTSPSGQNQTFTVTRSVNNVVKTHSTGAQVRLADPNRWGL